MCGIVGYTGSGAKQAAPILLDSLSKLEYRGYDSAGMAVYDDETKSIQFQKTVGRLKGLYDRTHGGADLKGTCGIGHTRWATHGEPTEVNAHPHLNSKQTIAVVHNGIIENYLRWRKRLQDKGYIFKSDTDTEVIVQMLDYYYDGDPLKTITTVMQRLEGSYALGILFSDHAGEIYAARKDSPLIVGKADDAAFIASDVPAILSYTRNVYYMENEEVARLTPGTVEFFNIDEEPVQKEAVTVSWDIHAAEKGGYEYFMLKEIHEEPKAVSDTLNPRIRDGHVVIDELNMTDEEIRGIHKLFIVACGSAYHAGVTGKYVMEGLARIPVEVDIASEFRYRDPIIEEGDYVIIISQSGETADSLAALREAKKRGARTLGIINVVGSSIAREADNVMYTWAGPEIAVATTKAYQTQLIAMYLLSIRFAKARGKIDDAQEKALIDDLKALPEQIRMQLASKADIQKFANRYLAAEHVFFIGRGIDYAISLEGSLKLKEISYVHSEAYPAGELKHGTISLIEDGRLVVAVLTQPNLIKKEISNIVEVKSRGAFVMAVTTVGNTEVEKTADYVVYVPKTNPYFVNSLAVVPLQLFGYYVAIGRGLDVDKPRNLAKSVTVE